MASRFWVGGAGTWDAVTTTHWSATSGGAGGVSVPTLGDDVTFNGSSGGGAVAISANAALCKTLTLTGFTGSIAKSGSGQVLTAGAVNLGGLVLDSTLSITIGAAAAITCGGGSFGTLSINAIGVTFADNFIATTSLTITEACTLDVQNHNVTIAAFTCLAVVATLTMGSGTWTLTGSGNVWQCGGATGLVVNANTSTIKLTDATSASKTFDGGGGKTYYNLWLTGAGTGVFIIQGSNTFNDFKVDTPPHTVQFGSGVTTVTTFTVSGSASAYMTLASNVDGTHWDIVCIADVSVTYVILSGSHAHGGTFTDTSGADAGGNRDWLFVSSFNTRAAADVYFDSAGVYGGSAVSTIGGVNWLIGESVGIKADGVDVGDATVTAAGNLTLPSGAAAASIWSYGKRYNSYAETLRAPETGNRDGASLGRRMIIHTVSADLLNTPYLLAGSLTGTERIPPDWRDYEAGEERTGLFEVPVDDSHHNEGVVVFETDKGYPAIVRAIRFQLNSEP